MHAFPFSALVGQERLQRALLLGAVQPRLGGVLVRGTKGIAKSTAVRGLAALLPPLETVAGCPMQRQPGEVIADWPLPAEAPVISRAAPLVELPLGATEDRVLGTLHLEKALHGQRVFQPGLLAAANRGILYIDEVNLLPDHLVDILLDAAASGVHRLERDGLSLVHPARFLLIGTMNPEEGELRPQLLDRFGLCVDGADLADPAERGLAVRRRLAFETDPVRFRAEWQAADAELAARIVAAQRLLPAVTITDEGLQAISQRCLQAGVQGLRADLTLAQAACAWAAFQGRRAVESADIDTVADLALAHRRGQPPDRPVGGKSRIEDRGSKIEKNDGPAGADLRSSIFGPRSAILDPQSSILDIAGLFAARVQPRRRVAGAPGRWRSKRADLGGHTSHQTQGQPSLGIAWLSTIRAAAVHQQQRGWRENTLLLLNAGDLRYRQRQAPAGRLLLFVVDTSGSMAAWQRMRQTKAAILALLLQAYRQQDRVSLLAFHGEQAEVILQPTSSVASLRAAVRALENLPTGGTTPLAAGLAAARQFIIQQQRRLPQLPIWTVILTDGRANVTGRAGGVSPRFVPQQGAYAPRSPWDDALQQARLLSSCAAEFLVVDTESGWPRFGRAGHLAAALGSGCVPLEAVLGKPLASGGVYPHWEAAS